MNLPPERHKIQYTHGLSTPYAVHTVQVMRYFPLTGGKVPREQNNVKINWFATKLYFDYLFVNIHNNVSVPWRFSLPAACWCVFANRNDRDLRRFKNRFRLNAQTNVKELRNNNWIIIASSRASSGWKRDGGRRKKNNVRNHQSFPPDTALCVDDFAPRVHWPTRVVVHFIAYRDGWIHPFSLCLPRILSQPLAHCPALSPSLCPPLVTALKPENKTFLALQRECYYGVLVPLNNFCYSRGYLCIRLTFSWR